MLAVIVVTNMIAHVSHVSLTNYTSKKMMYAGIKMGEKYIGKNRGYK